jgi:glycine cleavage system T protein
MLKTTGLHATHKALGAKMVPFGGWDMPVWYASAREEHLTVRNAAGLFDVSHMGVIDARGPNACAFLDRLTTNDVSKLRLGASQYGYLLNDAGSVLDDLMIYRLGPERYLVVINASNNDADIAWLRDHNTGEDACELRDLRDAASGDDQRVDVALQGPTSQTLLAGLMSADDAAVLTALPYAGVMHGAVAGIDLFVSRTGYTGERIAYELFVHPAQIVQLWAAICASGARPCGLAARDSLRTEAGLPLYGHELGGPLDLAPFHIGFDNYVKTGKAASFIGREAYVTRANTASGRLVRFRMTERSVRPSKTGDPVIDKRGRVIGSVTSCAQDSGGLLTGLALIDGATPPAEGTSLGIVALPEKLPEPLKPFAAPGSRMLVPDNASVISRFPPRPAGSK